MLYRQSILRLAGLLALALPISATATNGYFAHGYGSTNKGLAGAGVAFPQDALATATNPAGIVRLGHRFDAGLALFSPDRGYTVEDCLDCGGFPLEGGTFESDNELFPIPHLGYNRPLDADTAIGIAVYGNGGMNTEYPSGDYLGGSPPGTFGAGTAGVDLIQLFVTPTYARQVNDRIAVGASAIFAYQAFEATGLGSFAAFSGDSSNLTNNGHNGSYGFGARLGLLAAVTPRFDVGISYQTKIWMSEFDDYAGLFAEQGDFDIPPSATVGLAAHVTDDLTFVFDIQRTWFSQVDSVGNTMLPALFSAPLGADSGAGFGWDDMTTYKAGLQWDSSDAWSWRIGYSHGKQPISSSEVLFNILAPGVVEDHFTFGFTHRMKNGNELSLAAMYAPEEEVTGTNPLDGQTITLRMEQYELELSYSFHMN